MQNEQTKNKNQSVNQFTQAAILEQIGSTRVNRFLRAFSNDLNAACIAIPEPAAENGRYFSSAATLFAGNAIPERLRHALFALEEAAAPENEDQLDAIAAEHIPHVNFAGRPPLDRALELWFTAPDSLSQFAPASPALNSASDDGGSSSSLAAPKSDEGASSSSNSGLNLDPNQKSKIETQKSLSPADPLTHSLTNSPLSLPDPHPWPDPVDGKQLLDTLSALASRFVILPMRAADTIALWILHTFAFQLRDISTYLGIESPIKRCGKTTLLAFLGEIAHRPIAAANVSPPALFRVIEDLTPALLIDEADTFLAANEQIRGILNAGYHRKNAYVLRAFNPGNPKSSSDDSEDETQPPQVQRFSCWCPKVIAAIGRLPDTLADRCVVISMQRKMPHEQCARLRDLVAEPFRQQCKRFVLDNADKIAAARPAPEPALNDRVADIWEPLFALADLAGGDWPQRAREAAAVLCARAEDSNPVGSLLLDIWAMLLENPDKRLFTRTIVGVLNLRTGRPWHDALNGKQVTDIWLAQQLKPYGIKSRTIWIRDEHAKGYTEADLLETCRRYISRTDVDALKAEWDAEKPPEQKTDTPNSTSLSA